MVTAVYAEGLVAWPLKDVVRKSPFKGKLLDFRIQQFFREAEDRTSGVYRNDIHKVNQEVFGLAVHFCWGRHVEGVCCACFGQSDMWGWNIWMWVKGWYFWNMISVKTGETVMTPHYLQRDGQNERICRRKMQVFLIYIKWEKCRALKGDLFVHPFLHTIRWPICLLYLIPFGNTYFSAETSWSMLF